MPPLVYRDWLGSRALRRPDGSFNLFFALSVEEVPEQTCVVTLRWGWRWSDGTEITAADAVTARLLQGDADVRGNRFYCAEVNGQPVTYEQLGRYRYRIVLPEPKVNALNDTCGFLPTHVFRPRYRQAGAAGVGELWNETSDPRDVVTGSPYVFAEVRPGERVVLARNPFYGASVRAAVVTGQLNLYQPASLEQARAVREALERGHIGESSTPT